MPKPKLIVVCGPTATGKSDLAVEIAKNIGGEIISADSRQVYTGLDLGTGKITKREMRGVPHYLLDVADPKRQFSVARYMKLTDKAIKDIIKRGKTPILCGGTGFYIDAVVSGASLPEVPPNKALRKELDRKTTEELFETLQKLDPKRAETIDKHNPVRLVRAIEIATALGSVPALSTDAKYETLFIGLDNSDDILKKKIGLRLKTRLKKGMLAEAKRLRANGLSWKRFFELGLEYRYMGLHLEGEISKDEMVAELEKEIWQYVRRQRTWFKRNKDIVWFDPGKKTDLRRAVALAKQFLK